MRLIWTGNFILEYLVYWNPSATLDLVVGIRWKSDADKSVGLFSQLTHQSINRSLRPGLYPIHRSIIQPVNQAFAAPLDSAVSLVTMKIWHSQHVFDHPWEMISQAAWRKYPNPSNPNIVAIDVLDRRMSTEGALTTSRLFTTKFAFPKWIIPFIPLSEYCYSTEKSIVNPSTRSMVLESRNLSLGTSLSSIRLSGRQIVRLIYRSIDWLMGGVWFVYGIIRSTSFVSEFVLHVAHLFDWFHIIRNGTLIDWLCDRLIDWLIESYLVTGVPSHVEVQVCSTHKFLFVFSLR